jgi:hypothetical protein
LLGTLLVAVFVDRILRAVRAGASATSLERVFRAGLGLLAAWYVALFCYIAARRLGYPYDLEWMEGGVYEHVARVLEGKPIYVPPSVEFAPYIYTPLYYWVSAPFVALLGPGLLGLRVVSLISSLVSFAALYALVWTSTRNRLAALVAAGAFAGCFELGGAWFDLARVDMLSLCLALLALLVLARSERYDALAGLLFALALLTKQSTGLIALPVLAARALTQRGWRRLAGPLACGVTIGGASLLLDATTHGWFRFYAFELPASHPLAREWRKGFWQLDLFAHLPFAAACLLFVLVQPLPWRQALPRIAFSCGLLASAWSGRLHAGGFENVLLPALLALSWALGEALHAWTDASSASAPGPSRAGVRFAYALCAVQLLWLWYTPGHHIPSDADRRASEHLVARLRNTRGRVLLPSHGHLARLAGKAPHGHEMAFHDVFLGKNEAVKKQLGASIVGAIEQQRFALVVLDGDWWKQAMDAHYVRDPLSEQLQKEAAFCRSGIPTAPKDAFVPRITNAAVATPGPIGPAL